MSNSSSKSATQSTGSAFSLAAALQPSPVVVNWLQKWCYDLVSYHHRKIRYYLNGSSHQALSGQIDMLECITLHLLFPSNNCRHPLNPPCSEELFIGYGDDA